ncbi:MAG: argininosuccinate lyase [Dehalococcoidales bacterium]|nr:argininosuccinate lyase [Dehalococcoidales bacterium]
MSLIRGRFEKEADEKVLQYTESISFDWRLSHQDIAGSIAHTKMLAKQGIITAAEGKAIVKGLNEIRQEIEQGKFKYRTELEDIHMNIESRLAEKIGEAGGKLHTGRSRNDQVATDLRLFTKEMITGAVGKIRALQAALLKLAEANKDVVVPGYTHLQPAQPVLFAHHLLAYFEMLQRDTGRFSDCLKRADVLPLGSGALAGVTYNIDREFVARELGFNQVSNNSMDAVADRDFIIEFDAAAAIGMMHLSRLAEEFVIWSSPQFGFIEIDEAYTTGSSIMPQKKNPDVAELARGKTGRVYGNLMALLTTMKALPLAYDRDMQEDKENFFDTIDTYFTTLDVFTGMVKTLKINALAAREALEQGYLLATDIADYLVRKGMAFRKAHQTVGKLVSYAAAENKPFNELKLKEYRSFSELFEKDVFDITIESSVAARNVTGGTAHKQVRQALKAAKKLLGGVIDR